MYLLFLPLSTKKQTVTLRNKGGFGLIELMVSISIMVLVTGVVLARQTAFDGAVLLRSEAYEVALSIREVQLSAVSAESKGLGSFRATEGIYFDTANDTTYLLFQDSPGGNFYYNASEQYGKPGNIDNRFEIRAMSATGATLHGTGLAIVFERPNFDAKFYDSNGQVNASKVYIEVSKRGALGSGIDEVRTVEVTRTGQITVN